MHTACAGTQWLHDIHNIIFLSSCTVFQYSCSVHCNIQVVSIFTQPYRISFLALSHMEATTHFALVFLASLFIMAGRKSVFSNILTVPQISSHFSPGSCYNLKRLNNYHCLCGEPVRWKGIRLGAETALVCQTRPPSAISGSP